MQSRISRVVYSNLLRNFSHLPVVQFSTIPSRPMRGEGRRDEAGNGSKDSFLRNLNFGDRDNAENPRQSPPPRSPNGPLTGDQRAVRRDRRERDDLFYQNLNAGSQVFRSLRENRDQKEQSKDTHFEKLNLGDVEIQDNAAEVPPRDADEIFRKMKESGLIPNAVAMLDGLCKDGMVQDAMKLFGLMREKGTIPDVVIYTAVVEGFCKAGKFDDAKRIFRKMQKNGIVPNAFSYAVVIQGLCSGKRLEDAVEFCMEMLDAGHSPNAATLTGLVSGFCKEKGVEEAEGLMRSLKEKGFAINEKAVREYLEKKGPHLPMVWEAIFGKKISQRPF